MPQAAERSDVFVVVPSYNHSRFVEQCLRSIFVQTVRPAKLLVIDDGSTDDSVKVIERVLADCTFEAELVSRPNRGLSATLNEAFEFVNTPFLAYLGSDDVWMPEFLESRQRTLADNPDAPLAFGDAYLIDDRSQVIDCTAEWPAYREAATLDGLLEASIPVTSSVVFRTAEVARFGWNEASILEDYELYMRLAARSRFARSDDRLALWRKHGHNVSNDSLLMLDQWLAAQQNVANSIGLSDLGARQRRLRFLSAASVLRSGQRTEAAGLVLKNRRGASSVREFASMLGRLILPDAIRGRLEERRRLRQIEKYRDVRSPTGDA